MRKIACYTCTDYRTDTEITKELNISPVVGKIQDYRMNWLRQVNGMPCNGLPGIIKTTAQRKAGGTRQDNRRDFWMCETGTGQQVAQRRDDDNDDGRRRHHHHHHHQTDRRGVCYLEKTSFQWIY